MNDSVSIQRLDVFPSTLLLFNYSNLFKLSEIDALKSDIDNTIETRPELLSLEENFPKIQSRPFLFREENLEKEHWRKLANCFLHSVKEYIKNVQDLCTGQDNIHIGSTRAWFYRSNGQVNKERPWHNHYPSFVSGVFYLHVPGDHSIGGTEFADPKWTDGRGGRDIVIAPALLSWLLFPGWLNHRPNFTDVDEHRYTIAADSYVYA